MLVGCSRLCRCLQQVISGPPGTDAVGQESARALTTALDGVLEHAAPVVAVSLTDQAQFAQRVASLDSIIQSASAKLQEVDAQRTKAIEGVAAIRNAAGQAGVHKNAAAFAALATKRSDEAGRWFAGIIASAALSVVLVFALVKAYPLQDGAKASTIVQYVMLRVVGFALASYLLVWAARNYRASRHLAVLNEHRAMALQTFDSFVVTASDDPATKNAVLLEAMRCIFTAGSTGYSSEEPSSPTDRIIEIAKTIVQK